MLLTLRIILAIIVVVLSVYSLITENYDFSFYTILFLGFMILVMGIDELQKDRKNFWGYISIIISLFIFLSLY